MFNEKTWASGFLNSMHAFGHIFFKYMSIKNSAKNETMYCEKCIAKNIAKIYKKTSRFSSM